MPAAGLPSPGVSGDLARRLLAWYRRERRDLPWRRPPPAGQEAAYRTWVSEVMLQQTRVEAVRPGFERFLARFPDVRTLAAAGEDEVLRLWSGLGYYRRARLLHRAARFLVRERGGRLPASAREWRELPGVGEYTAAAIASICAGEAVPVVDGNVRRVAARVLALDEAADSAALHRAARSWAGALHAAVARQGGGDHGDLNQALMELGATVCRPAAADCASCPLARACAGREQGRALALPRPAARPVWRDVPLVMAVAVRAGAVLLERRRTGWNPGLWEPPSWPDPPPGGLARAWRRRYGPGAPGREAALLRHTITRHRIRCRVIAVEGWSGAGGVDPRAVPLTSLARKALLAAGVSLASSP